MVHGTSKGKVKVSCEELFRVNYFTQPCGTQPHGNRFYATISRQRINWDGGKGKRNPSICYICIFFSLLRYLTPYLSFIK